MAAKSNRTTIAVRPDIRDGLKHIARKDQSYNELLADLIKLHNDHGRVLEIKENINPGPRDQSQARIASSSVGGGSP